MSKGDQREGRKGRWESSKKEKERNGEGLRE